MDANIIRDRDRRIAVVFVNDYYDDLQLLAGGREHQLGNVSLNTENGLVPRPPTATKNSCSKFVPLSTRIGTELNMATASI